MYFAQLAAPVPLLHTWSLAIEEQFYIVWPLVVLSSLVLLRYALSAPGSTVVLLTCPYISQAEQSDGRPWPDDNPRRVDLYNALLRSAAAEHPGSVRVVDLGAHISVGAHFTQTMAGIQIRAADGVHFTTAGGVWIQPWLLSQLASIGMQTRRAARPGTLVVAASP